MRGRKLLILLVLLLLMVRLEPAGTELDRLEPVEVLCMDYRDGFVWMDTDTGAAGAGRTVEQALVSLKNTNEAVVFLETTRFVLVTSEAEPLLAGLFDRIPGSARVCKLAADDKASEAAAFLRNHRPELTMREIRAGMPLLQVVYKEEGRRSLVG